MKQELNKLKQDVQAAVEKIKNDEQLEELKVKYLGRKQGKLTQLMKKVKDLSLEQKREIGQVANAVRNDVEDLFATAKKDLSQLKNKTDLDVTLPGVMPKQGHLHPLTRIRLEVEAVFKTMGFEVHEGDELTNLYYNFLSLNFPEDHPAMDDYDTFYIKHKKNHPELAERQVMRAHTSNMQVRVMEEKKKSLRVIVPGRCFRNEATDASHEHTFHQIEGFVVDKGVTIANLIWTQKKLLSAIFKQEVEVRLRPGYFPFVEPGFELDCSCLICKGKGCSVCKRTGWVELIPCGMIHPKVLENGGCPPGEYTGFAFGMGWSRLAMMKYGINDIRLFMGGDLRFLEQF